ncbi:portal protein, partial [Flammeovirga aprica]|uniref:portal protein n=1 Tax=Flammeovirga aprica TaxID=29528 RepID=UPI00198239A8
LYLPEPEGYTPMKLYRLNSYVVQRDAFGNVLQIVTLDKIAFNALPEDVRSQVEAAQGEQKEDAEIDVYTHVYLNEAGDGYSKYEEVAEEVVKWVKRAPEAGETLWDCIKSIGAKAGMTEEEVIKQGQMARILRSDEYNIETGEITLWQPGS